MSGADGPDVVARLFAAIVAARSESPAASRTARLLQEGPSKMARKVVEEAVEVARDAVTGGRRKVIEGSAARGYNRAGRWGGPPWSPRTTRAT